MECLGTMATRLDPVWLGVKREVRLPTALLGLPEATLGTALWLVEFRQEELSPPGAEPIGVVGDGRGGRLYLWKDKYWSEYALDWAVVQRCPQLREHTAAVRQVAQSVLISPTTELDFYSRVLVEYREAPTWVDRCTPTSDH